jgi:hypothetical protein
MTRLRTALLPALLLPLAACGTESSAQPAPGERFTLVEHVQVSGTCFEDHVGESAPYAGFVDIWRDRTKNRDLLHGSVANFDRPSAAEPKKYRPPAAIEFGEVGADQLAGPRVVLKGLTGGPKPSAATCTLDVKKRERPGGAGPIAIPMTARTVLSAAALVIGVVAGIRLTRHQARRSTAPLFLALALLLQLACLLLP